MTSWCNYAVMSLIFALLPTSTWVKCPRNLVEIHGHVRCTVHAGDKVLASLLFGEHQEEGTWPETALDVQDGAFHGEAAFSTSASNRDEKCNAKPTAVLVRLIEADGAEWDRTVLKISDAFRHDVQHGEYKLLTDLTLSGCCEPCKPKDEAPCADSKKD